MLRQRIESEKAKLLWNMFFEKYAIFEKNLCAKAELNIRTDFISTEECERLKKALALGQWDDTIFSSPFLPELILFLYQSSEITFHQCCTLLERNQTFVDFPHYNTFQILDEDGNFNEAAKNILLPALNNQKCFNKLDELALEKLRSMIACLPFSEQIFYTTSLGKLENDKEDSLGNTLLSLDTLIKTNDYLIHTSTGVFDAIGLIRFGIDEYVRPVHRLGVQTIDEIEQGVRAYARFTVLCYPGIKAYDDIHGYDNVTALEAASHDRYHAMVQSAIPKLITHAILYMVDLIRAYTHYQRSKEIWTLIDGEFIHPLCIFKTGVLPPKSNEEWTRLFCETIKIGNNNILNNSAYSFLTSRDEIGPLFILIILDMHKNPENWAKFNIEMQYLTEQFKTCYQGIEAIFSYIEHDEMTMQIQKCQLYFYLLNISQGDENEALTRFSVLVSIIDENKSSIMEKSKYEKVMREACDIFIAKTDLGEEERMNTPCVSPIVYFISGEKIFFMDKSRKKSIPISLNTQAVNLLKKKLLVKDGLTAKLPFSKQKKINEIANFKRPDDNRLNTLYLSYKGKKLIRDILSDILRNDYINKHKSGGKKASKKYEKAILDFAYTRKEAEEYANEYLKENQSRYDTSLFSFHAIKFDKENENNEGENYRLCI